LASEGPVTLPITRGLYDKPNLNALTGKSTHPDPRSAIDALARCDSAANSPSFFWKAVTTDKAEQLLSHK
jgi:hypothetical protein